MREILFRGKRVDNGEWIIGNLDISKDWQNKFVEAKIKPIELSPWDYKIIPETVCQYTGIDDKYGIKIFEGDIINIDEDNEAIGLIAWDSDTARFTIEYDNVCADFDNYYGNELQVIGDIHDNPELLEVQQ